MANFIGKAMWAKVNTKVDVYEGKELGYVINVYPSNKKDLEKLKEEAFKVYEEAKTSPDYFVNGKPVKWSDNPLMPFKEDSEEKEFVVFKTKHTVQNKETKIEEKRIVPVMDKYGKRIDNTEIGNDSTVNVAYTMKAYRNNANICGVKLYLNAIQVKELVSFGGSDASSFGFEVEEKKNEFGFNEEDGDLPL